MSHREPANDSPADDDHNREPRIYRCMVFEEDRHGARIPLAGSERNMLGVRLPPANRRDVTPDEHGNVAPAASGLSVGPNIKALPPGLVPERLRNRRSGARGSNAMRLFRLGDGAFQQSHIAPDLELFLTSKKHAVIRPRQTMPVDLFQQSLADTRPRWFDEG